MSDRKAELERKKAKLQAIRDERERKKKDLETARKAKEQRLAQSLSADSPIVRRLQFKTDETQSATADLRSEADRLLEEMGIPLASPEAALAASENNAVTETGERLTPVLSPRLLRRRGVSPSLQISKVTQTNIPPKELVTYSKEVQTVHTEQEHEDEDNESLDVSLPNSAVNKVAPADIANILQQVQMPTPIEEKPEAVKELTEEEKWQITNSAEFCRFVDRSVRIVERAIEEDIDLFIDYSGGEGTDVEGALGEGEMLKLNRQFNDDRWSRHRTVTCMDWSTLHPELLVASYNTNDDAPFEPDGIALIWNIKYKKNTPEYIFHCQSAIMSTCFAKFHPNLIVGGTYSGKIVLWDNRSNKRTPVQRTPLSASAHTHPVYCVNVVGTQNAHNLISISTDGKLCSWSLDMLSQPQDSLELQRQSKNVAVTSMSFLSADVNNFLVGSEDGNVYAASRHGSKAGISEMYDGHQGFITGIHANSVQGQIDFSHYFLTSSFDWTVKLWNMKENKPLYSFEDNNDYVFDTQWSPIHPALFSTVDGLGRIDLWNLNNDTEVPTASKVADGNVAFNRCCWHQSGHQIAAGDDLGKIHMYDVGENLANPKTDEWNQFVHTLQELKHQKNEQEEDYSLANKMR